MPCPDQRRDGKGPMTQSHPLRFGIVAAQRAAWPELVARYREAEALGFDVISAVDHFYGLLDVEDPTHEALTALAGLALVTERIRLGIMVVGNTYRNPAFLLKQAVTVDHISGGRLDFGVGAGWLEREHEAYGFELPPPRERVDRFAEALEIWDLLQRNERTTYDGVHYQLLDAPFAPKPLQRPRLPLLIGASKPRMLRLVAQHADIWNTIGSPAETGATNARLDELCREVGRDPAAIMRSVSVPMEALDSVDAFATAIEAYRAVGFTDFQIPWPRTPTNHDVLRRAAREVIPGMRMA